MCGSLGLGLGLGLGGSFNPGGTLVGSGGNPSLSKPQCTDERGREEEVSQICILCNEML